MKRLLVAILLQKLDNLKLGRLDLNKADELKNLQQTGDAVTKLNDCSNDLKLILSISPGEGLDRAQMIKIENDLMP